MRKLLCKWFKMHKWMDISKPVVGRRNNSYQRADGVVVQDLGPEETFYPSPNGPIHPQRECIHCGEKQIEFEYGWR